MTTASSKHMIATLMLSASVFLTGCVGGTTYGTGVTQERQLLNDLEGMISLGGSKKRKTAIDYSARPDLVLPNQSATLAAPQEQVASTSNTNWPESPEARIARIRGDAGVADPRSGELPVGELQRNKTGLRIGKKEYVDIDREGASTQELNDGSHKKAQALKKKYAYSSGPTRKYLTEPPVAYRTPIGENGVGDLGISEAEKERRAEKAAKIKKQNDTGMWTGG